MRCSTNCSESFAADALSMTDAGSWVVEACEAGGRFADMSRPEVVSAHTPHAHVQPSITCSENSPVGVVATATATVGIRLQMDDAVA